MNFYKKVQKPNFLPYKQRVTGSNPVAPTSKIKGFGRSASKPFFYLYKILTNHGDTMIWLSEFCFHVNHANILLQRHSSGWSNNPTPRNSAGSCHGIRPLCLPGKLWIFVIVDIYQWIHFEISIKRGFPYAPNCIFLTCGTP